MRSYCVQALRNHLHAIIIVPLVIIMMSWPTFPRLFDGDEIWLHTKHRDRWQQFWEAGHIERVLAGQTSLFYTDFMFHPQGASLAFNLSVPSALLLVVMQKLVSADDAFNLLFLLILCFNALCAYVLIQHLIKDRWIALFGAVVVGVSVPFLQESTLPVLITIGTLPLSLYFFHRTVYESRMLFAAAAGICLGITAHISLYIFVFTLLSAAIYTIVAPRSYWKQSASWLQLFIIIGIGGALALLRLYPILADAAVREEGLAFNIGRIRSNDLIDFFVLTKNPFTGTFLHSAFNVAPNSSHHGAYLGYINLVFIGGALVKLSPRRKIMPWLAMLAFFLTLRLGHFLTINGNDYPDIVLPERLLSDWIPALFGNIGRQEYYQFAVVLPLALLSSYGFAVLLRSKPSKIRALAALIAVAIVCFEFYLPIEGESFDQKKAAFRDWLKSETVEPTKVINLPQNEANAQYFRYLQTTTGYPQAYGHLTRTEKTAKSYIYSNLFLRNWDESRNVHCLPHNQETYLSALDQLLADGFTHIVEHNWLYGDQFIEKSFWNVPASYNDDFVNVYRLSDMRLSCEAVQVDIPYIDHYLRSSLLTPGQRSTVLSFDPKERIEDERFSFLDSLFSDWHGYVHLYFDDGKLMLQSADDRYTSLDEVMRDSQTIYLLRDSLEAAPAILDGYIPADQFESCQREIHQDGSVAEVFVSRAFSCALVISEDRIQVQYDNGLRIANIMLEASQDIVDVQIMWLPPALKEPHSISTQVFDASGAKVLGQDSTIGYSTLTRQLTDVSTLPSGDYVVKLIVYNYNTGLTASGTALKDGARFERQLEIATINRT
ncbi:MAG: hypothetical protein OXN88_04835 [Chloroflexota bacterium]|nr:hypothetical protein [Chloroflexota bacterium]